MLTGPDGTHAEVNNENELVTRSITQSELEHASSQGMAFSWTSDAVAWSAGDTMLYIRNTGNTPLILDRVSIPGDGTGRTDYSVRIGAATTTPTGTTEVAGTNMNEIYSTTAAEALAYSDETSVADGAIVDWFTVTVTESHQHGLDGVILGKNHYIQVNTEDTSTDATRCSVIGHYANPS